MLPSTALWFLAVFLITRAHAQSNSSTLPVGSCTPTIPCSNGACCNGDSGFCGFGQAFCKQVSEGGPCTSNCDALAECGPNAAPTNFTCPLNVCCSQFGFCGTTEEFCGTGCQSNCSPPGPASCGPEQQSALHRRIGYYEGWAASRSCSYTPEMISADTLTHINFAFALISDSFTITEMSPGDAALWIRTTALKKNNVALKVFLSIGGWSFNDPPTSQIFSQLVGSDANTATFIASALNTLQAYGFDGIDVDWEYPAAFDRGGSPADKANYVTFMSKVKAAFGPRNYGLTFTAPSSYWYLQHFDLPGLMQYADWVNVMTYDLHGTWDGVDPYIGSIVLAHTNLTEIQDTLSLFNNVGIDPSKIVLGIGFYGRSFQLADSGCTSPGCAFVGGADPGPCSANSGTLMFSEIETIIAQNGLNPIFDEAAAVKYIVWNDDQWVSYDDAQTLQMKVQFANSRCLGGTMIWSVDQDDMHYTALSSLYPGIDVNNPSAVESGDQCAITGCGQSCPDGWDTLTTLTTNPGSATSCDPNSPAKLCCPSGNAPQNCHWTGGGGSTCNPACGVGELTLATDPVGGDGNPTCAQGTKAFCCQTGQNDPTGCHATACGESSSTCASTDSFLTFVRQGSDDGGSCAALNSDPIIINNEPCPTICSTNNKPVCCESSVISAYSNCHWVGDLPNCLNAACPTGQVGIFSDIQGDASQSCIGDGRRLYCCNPPNNEQFLPVPESWVLPSLDPTPGGHGVLQPATFTVDFDDNIGTSDTSQTGAGSSGESDDGKENDSPFGEVFISSPNPGSVSSLDLASDWVIHGCDRSSDQPQEVLAHCSKSLDGDDSGCGHVFITQAEHTIVRMPTTCGRGPYARVVSLVPHDDQDALPSHLRRALPENELVYSLKFDYDFAAVPDANGPILMRADVTDMPGYWNEMINTAPDEGTTSTKRSNRKRDYHQPEELERRWFGTFARWVEKLNTVKNGNSISRNFHWSDTYTIFHQEESCPNFSSSLDITVAGMAQANSRFGYYLEATIVPPAIQQCYVYLSAGASAQATFTITGLAEAHFGTERAEIISFGFPGLYYPGLLTLGPSLHLYGELTGQLSMSGSYKTSVGYEFPSIDLTFGKEDTNNDVEEISNGVDPNFNNNGFDYSFGANVNLEGGVEAHLVPSLQLGISVLGGSVLDAQVFAEADIYAGVGITGSVSTAVAPNFCVNPYFGVDLNAGLTGSVLFWRDNTVSHSFYSEQFPFGGGCFNSADQASGSGNSRRGDTFSSKNATGSPLAISHRSPYSAYTAYENVTQKWITPPTLPIEVRPELSRISKRGVPFLPGNLFCPDVGSKIVSSDDASDCMFYSDADDNDPEGPSILSRSVLKPEIESDFDNTTSSGPFHVFASRASREAGMWRCKDLDVPIPVYGDTPIIAYYDLANPASLDPTVIDHIPVPVNLGRMPNGERYLSVPKGHGNTIIYAREHPYEASMASVFIDYLILQTDLWQNANNDAKFCPWVTENLKNAPTAYSPAGFGGKSLFAMLGTCYPSNAGGTPMAIYEQSANIMKRTAFFDMEHQLNQYSFKASPFRSDKNFKTYCPKKQIAVMRSAAGIPSFLNRFEIRDIFLNMNTCVRGVWSQWATAYQNSNVDAPNRANVNVPNLYDNWIHLVVANVPTFVRNSVQHLIPLYNKGQTTAATVDLSFPVLLDTVQFTRNGGPVQNVQIDPNSYASGVAVTQADLTAQIFNQIQDINWINSLPFH